MNSIFVTERQKEKRVKVQGLPSKYGKIILARLEKKGSYYSLQTIYNTATGRTKNIEVLLEITRLKKETLEAKKALLELQFEVEQLNDCITKKREKPT